MDYDWPIFLLARAFANWPFALRHFAFGEKPFATLPLAKSPSPRIGEKPFASGKGPFATLWQKPRAPLEGGLGQGLGALSSPSPPPLGPDKPLGS